MLQVKKKQLLMKSGNNDGDNSNDPLTANQAPSLNSPVFDFSRSCFTFTSVFSFLRLTLASFSLCLSWTSCGLALTILRGVKVKSVGGSGGSARCCCFFF